MAGVEGPTKKLKLEGPLIGTHSGHFHADEALAVYLLRLLPTYKDSPLVRTRDPAVLSTCDTVVDVGGEHDINAKRFDHHQRGFDVVFPGHGTKLSSAGLVYLRFGKEIISHVSGLPADSPDVAILYEKIYSDFIEAFDANDNGVNAYDTSALKAAGISKKFDDKNFSLASAVGRFNYTKKAPANATKEQAQALEDENFLRASAFVGEQFLLHLEDGYENWLPARAVVRDAYNAREEHHASKQILVLENGGVPWSTHLYALEAENPSEPHVLYILFPESTEPESKWRIRAVSIENGAFENRKDLPDAWKGLRDEELSKVSGIPGGVFVHAAGFIGGNLTKEGALAMAAKAIET